ncbi:MAG: hypothetical protein R3A46_12070 [Thermomicrobiales bacterium]
MAFAGKHGRRRKRATGAGLIELNGHNTDEQGGRIAIFTASAIGYVDYPEALYARSLAWGLHERGHTVRMLEERRNPTLRRTLEAVGSGASRHIYEAFPGVLIHSFEPRSGAPLMEWIARELSLVDLAIAIDGLPDEVARWIANLDHRDLTRAFLTYRPDDLTDERAGELELERYDRIFATSQPVASVRWEPLKISIAEQDAATIDSQYLPSVPEGLSATGNEVARSLEAIIPANIRR